MERAEWMRRASRQHGYTLIEIADAAGLHYSSVGKIIKGWENSRFKTRPRRASFFAVKGWNNSQFKT